MPHAFIDAAVRILHVNKLLDARRNMLLQEVAATSIGLLIGAFLFGKKGAFAGALMGAILAYEPTPDYKKVLARVKALDDAQKETLAGLLRHQCGGQTLEEFALFSENPDNAQDIFSTINDYLTAIDN
ncbi:unnamed protein product, partial [Mesorhabditis spiculigera]